MAAEVVEHLAGATLPRTAISARPPAPVRIDHGDVVRQVAGCRSGPDCRRHPDHINLSSVVDQAAQQVNEEEERRRDRRRRHRREVENDVSSRAARGGTKLLPNLADELRNATMQGFGHPSGVTRRRTGPSSPTHLGIRSGTGPDTTRALSAAPLSSHPPQPDRRRERDVLTTDGFPAHTMSDAAGSTMAQAVVVVPTPRAAPMSGSNELSRPKRSPLHTFRNGCLAHRKCCCDRVQKVADEQLQLRALGGHASGLRP